MAKKKVKKFEGFKDNLMDKTSIAKEKIIHTKDKVAEKAGEAREKLENAAKKTGRYIDKHPRRAAAIAVGIGALVGAALMAGTRRKKRGFFS